MPALSSCLQKALRLEAGDLPCSYHVVSRRLVDRDCPDLFAYSHTKAPESLAEEVQRTACSCLHSHALKQDSMHGAVFDVSGKADLMLLLRRWHQCCDPVVREGRSLQLSEPGDPGG